MKPSLGAFINPAAPAVIDVQRLLETRMLIQANAGGGKSWAIRRLLEQTAGLVQQLVVDPEGEFATLREKHDFVIAAPHDGDTIAHPRSAALLARRLLETGVSAILDIYDLKAHERQAFVRLFFDALVNAPKSLWRPCLVILDEAHMFCPEAGKAESAGAVIDLASRGRKRGFALVAATQRLSKLHKDTAAELLNKLVGRTGLDVDVKRAADELGMTAKEAIGTLRSLEPGSFYGYGPALSTTVRALQIGQVHTTHPKAGDRVLRAPPNPTAAIKALLPKLADLPKEAEQEARTAEELRRELANVRRELSLAKKPGAGSTATIEDLATAVARGRERGAAETRKELTRAYQALRTRLLGAIDAIAQSQKASLQRQVAELFEEVKAAAPENPDSQGTSIGTRARHPETARAEAHHATLRRQIDGAAAPLNGDRPPVQQRVLDALAELEQLGAAAPARELVAFMAGYTHLQSTGFGKAMSGLRTSGLIDYPPSGGTVVLTEAGRAAARPADRPTTAEELQRRIVAMLGGATSKVLQPLIEAYPKALERSEVAAAAGYGHLQSTGFVKAMGRLRTLGFVDYPDRGTVVAKPVLFLEGP